MYPLFIMTVYTYSVRENGSKYQVVCCGESGYQEGISIESERKEFGHSGGGITGEAFMRLPKLEATTSILANERPEQFYSWTRAFV